MIAIEKSTMNKNQLYVISLSCINTILVSLSQQMLTRMDYMNICTWITIGLRKAGIHFLFELMISWLGLLL